MSADVVVVGAGLAGCTAATLYGRADLSVVLVETHADASTFKRSCTHFIQPNAVGTMQRLGVDRMIEEAGGVPGTIDFWTPYGWVDNDRSADPAGRRGYN